jgi:hypothetical protein
MPENKKTSKKKEAPKKEAKKITPKKEEPKKEETPKAEPKVEPKAKATTPKLKTAGELLKAYGAASAGKDAATKAKLKVKLKEDLAALKKK